MQPQIAIIDYGMGNLRSVRNALTFLGVEPRITYDADEIARADGLVLPGVGAFGEAMHNLETHGLVEVLEAQVRQQQTPILGICLGMQLMAQDSQEMGFHQGLGWIDGHVVPLQPDGGLRVPQVGWNDLSIKSGTPLFANLSGRPHYYFDHSLHLQCDDALVTARCTYGGGVVAAIQQGHILATQFHPEKSQVAGLRLLRNFLNFVLAGEGARC